MLLSLMKKILLTLVLYLVVDIQIQAEIYNFAHLDNTQGLSNNQIECIFKDSRGFMWIGTNFGLNRYDGYHLKVYKSIKNDSTSLIYNSIPRIQEDKNGNLWVAGNIWIPGNPRYVIYDICNERFNRNILKYVLPLGIHFIPALVEISPQKDYYFSKKNDGVYKYDNSTKKLYHFKQSTNINTLSKGVITNIRPDHGFFWVLFQSGLLERVNEKTNTVDFRNRYVLENSIGSSIFKNLYIDSEGCPWIYPGIGDKGALYFNMSKGQWIFFGNDKKEFHSSTDKYIASDLVRDIAQDNNGRIWLATDHGGVNIYDKKTNDITVLLNDPLNPSSLSQNSAISLYYDNTGIMWVGTYKNGVSYYHPGMFKFDKSPLFFYHNPDLVTKDCNRLYEDRLGNLWIGTNGSGVLKFDTKTQSFRLYRTQKNNPSSISSDIVISMLEDKKGTMWFGTFMGGLNQMVGEKFKRYLPNVNNTNSLSNKSIYGLVEDHRQNIWIGTLGGGLDELDVTRQNFHHHVIGTTTGMSSNYVLSIYSKDSANMYLSTSSGIDLLNSETKTVTPVFKGHFQLNKLSDLIIYNSLIDRRNQLWLATDNGINVYNPKLNSITYIDKTSGLPTDQVVSLVEDNSGNIWAGTRNGLACIYCSTNSRTHKYEYSVVSFDENDGLVSAILNQNAIFKNKQGEIYIGCIKGYTVFDPKAIHFNKKVPQPRFTEILIGNVEIQPGAKYRNRVILDASITHKNKIVLHYDEKNLTVNFSALSYIHPEKNRYRYKLKGFDEDWTEIKTGIGSASYSNLNQGTYQLIVYASNNDNVWSTKPLILEIVIQPPFWLSWWAYLLYFIIGVIALWYIVNFNLRKQKREFENEQIKREAIQLHEVDEMKFRFFTNISHEFRTPLTLIISPVEKLLKGIKTDEQKSLLLIIQRNANGLLELVNQLLDFRKLDVHKDALNISVGDVVSFINDIYYSFNELANRKSINFSFSTSVSELRIEFDPEKMRKIVSNLLSNAFKFTPNNGQIGVNVGLIRQMNGDKQLLKITISDSGIGIPPKDLERIFERFYRVENPENGHQTGTGVGLHIVSEYVKLHQGDIGVESQLGKGSVFTVTIPAKQHLQDEIINQNLPGSINPEVHTQEEEAAVEEHRKKLPLMLIVDDNEDFRNFISALFIESYRILKAEDGVMAFQMILDKMPDLIISDVMMPKMDGFELCKKVKQDIRISHIPIILLTAKAGDENKYRGLESGAEDYIAKPFNMEMLSLKVARIVERQKKTREQFKSKVDITTNEVEITSMDVKFVKKAVALVEANISSSEFLVENLCREMGMSRVYFYKKILSLTDKTPSEFIRFIRLKRAAEFLEKSQLFVNEVAFQVGFNDPRYFRKYFKAEFGVSPNDYKKKFTDS
jgi:signal transduction histidine kinase/ligand-binding sensor domain-containing protein/DNA-binding response OmpR family regulator